MAQVWEPYGLPPAATAVAFVIPLTAAGVGLFVVVPLPSWPELFQPQHLTVPPMRRAQLWYSPAVIAVAVVIPLTATGVELVVVVPLPS
jgi:hypothetical protein